MAIPFLSSPRRGPIFWRLQSQQPESPILTSAQRRRLRGRAQLLDPVLKVGHGGVTAAFLASVAAELARHELIKVRFVDFREEKHELAEKIAAETGGALVQVVGHVAVFYRPKPETAAARS